MIFNINNNNQIHKVINAVDIMTTASWKTKKKQKKQSSNVACFPLSFPNRNLNSVLKKSLKMPPFGLPAETYSSTISTVRGP